MVLQVILCALSAAGLLLIVWCAVGNMLLPVDRSLVCVYVLRDGDQALEQTARAFDWLCESNFLAGTLLVVDCTGDDALHTIAGRVCDGSPRVQLCGPEELAKLLKLES